MKKEQEMEVVMEVAEKEKGDVHLCRRCKFVLFLLRYLYAQENQHNISLQNFMIYTYHFNFAGILNGPDIRRLMKDQAFKNALKVDELVAYVSVKAVIENVLGSYRA
ncbi:unnamed protein product [Brassicogethes aeneus]|uniref:Uncharacterized protein n=1 Tax=Brassicogethes aeneus TaxID=1431903 RepID=A0A9P0FAD9_BRAAE|nr:unnamed protein product [Brassicogethes aeneus]